MNPADARPLDATARRDYLLLAAIAAVVAISTLIFYFHRDAILLYGDAVAHINIARRVFDSRTPGVFQLGTVWLPLPHLLDIPFIVNDRLWQTGLGASVPSMVAYVAGTLGVFRLVSGLASRAAAWIAALIYALNPNLIYMQATAMTESLYLALFVWAVVYFSEFVRQARDDPERGRSSLEKCALMIATAMMVRYDGWFLAAAVAVAVVIVFLRLRLFAKPLRANSSGAMRRGLRNFFLLTGLTAGLWLAYNHSAYGNALEFANGPYSARAIQQRSRTATMPSYPGENTPRTATLYLLKLARLNMGAGRWEYFLLSAALVAFLAAICFSRRFLPWSLLWTPVLFYVLCVAWGSVPIYFPDWWPYSYYNVRYGLQLLPAMAVFVALAYEFLSKFVAARLVGGLMAVALGGSYFSVWQTTPICLREAQANGKARMMFEEELARELNKLPVSSTLMMDCGAHSGAIQQAGIRFRRVLRESNPPYWEIALSRPAESADYVIAQQGDDVSRAVRLFPQGLERVATVDVSGQPKVFIYRSVRFSAPRYPLRALSAVYPASSRTHAVRAGAQRCYNRAVFLR
jgi:hypothetical protein